MPQLKKAVLDTSASSVMARIEALEQAVLPALAVIFPSLFPYVPAVAAVTGAADAVIDAIGGDDTTHADAIATVAAVATTKPAAPNTVAPKDTGVIIAPAAAPAAAAVVQPASAAQPAAAAPVMYTPDQVNAMIQSAVAQALKAAGVAVA